MSDSQNEGISVLDDIPESTDSSEAEVEQPTYDLSALQKQLQEVQVQAATKADIENLRRQAGHVPALQRELAELKAELTKRDADSERLSVLEDLLIDALPVDRAERYEQERAQRQQVSALDEKLQPIIDRLDQVASPQPQAREEYDDPRFVIAQAQAEAANTFVTNYATDKGIDVNSIPKEVYDLARDRSFNPAIGVVDWGAATQEVLKYVDEQATKNAATERRAERKEAASGGSPTERQGSMGQYDFSTIAGLAQAKKDGAIDSVKFMEEYRRLRGGVI